MKQAVEAHASDTRPAQVRKLRLGPISASRTYLIRWTHTLGADRWWKLLAKPVHLRETCASPCRNRSAGFER